MNRKEREMISKKQKYIHELLESSPEFTIGMIMNNIFGYNKIIQEAIFILEDNDSDLSIEARVYETTNLLNKYLTSMLEEASAIQEYQRIKSQL